MEIVQKPLSELKPSEKNVRKHNQFQLKELAKAISTFGVIRPIICDESGFILCGHGLYEALKLNGAETASCMVMPGLSEKQKMKLMLADNKIYDLGTSDYDVIEEMLKSFGSEGDFSIPGYDPETLEDLYGLRSVEAAAQAVRDIATMPTQQYTAPQQEQPNEAPTPTAHVQEERNQAMMRRIIVCPNCGETIEV